MSIVTNLDRIKIEIKKIIKQAMYQTHVHRNIFSHLLLSFYFLPFPFRFVLFCLYVSLSNHSSKIIKLITSSQNPTKEVTAAATWGKMEVLQCQETSVCKANMTRNIIFKREVFTVQWIINLQSASDRKIYIFLSFPL